MTEDKYTGRYRLELKIHLFLIANRFEKRFVMFYYKQVR